jgi:tetratricopeptide (TPR) repeat protein
MFRKILTVILLGLAAAPAAAFDRSELAEFNDMYRSGRYEEALDGYKTIITQEPSDPWAYYNAGNALFRLNRLGPAVLYYSKAFMLDPRSSDIRANLDFALHQTGQTLAPEGVPNALYTVYYFFTDAELKMAVILFFWLACLAGAGRFLFEDSRTGKAAGSAALVSGALLLFCLLWLGARTTSPFYDGGVVTNSGGTKMLSGPGDNFKTYASAPEGRLVKILDSSDDNYYEIGLPREGIKGWALKSEIERL